MCVHDVGGCASFFFQIYLHEKNRKSFRNILTDELFKRKFIVLISSKQVYLVNFEAIKAYVVATVTAHTQRCDFDETDEEIRNRRAVGRSVARCEFFNRRTNTHQQRTAHTQHTHYVRRDFIFVKMRTTFRQQRKKKKKLFLLMP